MVTYRQSGVNIDLANSFVEYIKKINPGIGGFSGLFPVKGTNYLLSASTDGVGTKLKLLLKYNLHETAGIDLVAMNVNDLVCCGAQPIFFLDYFACGKLDLTTAKAIIRGIVDGCKQSQCQLLGGETAEMPGFYPGKEYDLAGFSVGLVEKSRVITGKKVQAGDVILGLPSSGPHSNGFSLIRKVLSESDISKYHNLLLKPTIIYVKPVMAMLNTPLRNGVHALSHITGGGFYDNILRLLPKNVDVHIDKASWHVPEIFKIIQKKGNVEEKEIYRVLNMGIGMAIVVSKHVADKVKSRLKSSRIIGEVVKGSGKVMLKD